MKNLRVGGGASELVDDKGVVTNMRQTDHVRTTSEAADISFKYAMLLAEFTAYCVHSRWVEARDNPVLSPQTWVTTSHLPHHHPKLFRSLAGR